MFSENNEFKLEINNCNISQYWEVNKFLNKTVQSSLKIILKYFELNKNENPNDQNLQNTVKAMLIGKLQN